ncbi:MAG: gliding motility protein GldN [Bacteroidales bacterium]|nr:gliding motility protein GldN [Bacteroidales bacterium]
MKKVLLSIFAVVAFAMAANAQSVIDADDGRNPNDFYQQGIVVGKKAMPYPFLRESDVVWRTTIWRKIDFNESFNQFFYFPYEAEKNTQGRINLVNLILQAVNNGAFEIYEDDDMKIPQDVETALRQTMSVSTKENEVGEDEWGEPIIQIDTIRDPLDAASVKMAQLKEFWYIDKQDTRQKVRIVGLSFQYTKDVIKAGNADTQTDWTFWVPMDFMTVRQVLVNANAYDETNDVAERSYDDIFVQRYFDSYVTRESNTHNRSITDYLTGVDAIYESQMIEEKIFDIESDMWEY